MKRLALLFLFVSSFAPLLDASAISMKFERADIRQVITTIAKVNDLNVIISDDVSGEVSLEFKQVNWQTALSLVLQVQGLEFELQDNILVVARLGELAKYRLEQNQLALQLARAEPLLTQSFVIKYAKAGELVETLKSSKGAILTERGQVTFDQRTNTILIKDSRLGISRVEQMLQVLDIKAKQVLIEARMVTIRDNVDQEFGIQWGITGELGHTRMSGSLAGLDRQRQSDLSTSSYLDRLMVNLPVANPAASIALQVAKLADGHLLDLELSALERESKGEVIAAPRILATDQVKSRIEQGTEIPYLQAAAHGATSVAFKKAVLSLEVTPQITPQGSIILDLVITQDARGDTVITSTGPAVAIDTQQIATRVTAKNGETIVLGGIYQEQMVSSVNKVPWLADIPILGRLFQSDASFSEKRQLLVFVTPKLLLEQN